MCVSSVRSVYAHMQRLDEEIRNIYSFQPFSLRHRLFQKVLVLAKMAGRYAPKISLYHLPLPDRYADCFSRLHSLSNEPSPPLSGLPGWVSAEEDMPNPPGIR